MIYFQYQSKHDNTEQIANPENLESEAFKAVTKEDIELCELLDAADNTELSEIADILGVIYQDDCKAAELINYPFEPENEKDFMGIIERIESNDSTLTEVSLNNIKSYQSAEWKRLFNALENINTEIKSLHTANCNLTDTDAVWISSALKKNSVIETLTLDSNLFTSKSIVQILQALSSNTSVLKDLRLNNQVI